MLRQMTGLVVATADRRVESHCLHVTHEQTRHVLNLFSSMGWVRLQVK
jgi:hypothetical protein